MSPYIRVSCPWLVTKGFRAARNAANHAARTPHTRPAAQNAAGIESSANISDSDWVDSSDDPNACIQTWSVM
jgi:hypothetical protein